MKNKEGLMNTNVFGLKLEICSKKPLTGFLRNGMCTGSENDFGQHFVCCLIDQKFLDFSFERGNDLKTPKPEFNFPGLKQGDKWCVCVDRWIEALNNNVAPKIFLKATNKLVLKKIDIETLKKFALDIN